MKLKQSIQVLGLIVLAAIGLAGCAQKEATEVVETPSKPSYIEDHAFQLDTIITIKLYGEEDSSLIDDSFSRIEELEKMLSVHLEGSDLAKVREEAGYSAVKVHPETMEVMEAAIQYAEFSEGLFDPTAGPLIELWGIDPPEGHVATEDELAEILPLIDYQKVLVDGEAGTIYLQDEKMIADLGAIAKGFIADKVKEQLVDAGVTSGIINLGGNVLLVGGKPDGSDFRIGVQDPDSLRGEYLGIVSLKDESIVTSGDYERFFEADGKKYHHILDPYTGFPAENSLRSVTIISPNSTDGDALSTTCFLLGLDKGIKLIRRMPSIDAIFVTEDDQMIFSSQDLLDRYQSTNEVMEEQVYTK
jgi:thiamine biosynthesis lipoprotein